MLVRHTFAVGKLQCNCTILADSAARQAVVIDPGDEVPRIVAQLVAEKFSLVGIVHTHAHIDHIGGCAELAAATGAPTYLHPDDTFLQQLLPMQAQLLGLPAMAPQPAVDRPLHDGGGIAFGAFALEVVHTPGHTPGSVCFALPGHDLCFSGDTLFAGGVGRTDLPGGDSHAISRSIRDRLYCMHGDVQVICGHGSSTTIDRERRSNPFVRA